jgi:hypothetical protein
MLFNLLREVIRHTRGHYINQTGKPIVKESCVLCEESIHVAFITTQIFHDEKMMIFIHGLCKMGLQIIGPSPQSQRFVKM